MEALALVGIYVLLLAVPAAGATALLAVLARVLRIDRRAPRFAWLLVGLAVPAAMAVRGLLLSRPWRTPDSLQDMIPPGPGLLFAALPALLLCLMTSRLILRRRPV